MFRILIVDDERIILNGIRMMIEEKLKFSFPIDIAVASNVPQAIELLDEFHPDLILTDIRMPVVDGFELIQYVRKKEPSKSIAILSSHADFEYAQQAIRYHVTDFILKPVDLNKLKDTIWRVYQQKLEQERSFLHSSMMEVRNMVLYDLPAQELTSGTEQIKQLFPYIYFTVVVLNLSQTEASYPNLLEQILLNYYDTCYCFLFQERKQLIAICNHNRFLLKPVDLKQQFIDAARCGELWIGVSISTTSFKKLHNLYVNAVQRIFYARHFGVGSSLIEISLITYQDCVNVFLAKEEAATRCLLKEFLDKVKSVSSEPVTPEMIYQSFFQNIALYLENHHIPVPEIFAEVDCSMADEQGLMDVIMAKLMDLKREIQTGNDYKGNDMLIKQLMDYIQKHYMEDVSLEELADYVGHHPNYVCTVFKKSVGQSYLTYIHKERLQVAKRMLLETDLTIEQISAEVGYNSSSQFARVFRKYEMVSPSDFRNFGEKR